MFANIILLITLTIFATVIGWIVRVAYWVLPFRLGYWVRRLLAVVTFPGIIGHFTGHVIGGYFADQNYRIVYRAHPKFSYAAGYLVPATFPGQHQSRSSVTKEDVKAQSMFLNLRRTTTIVLMPFPTIILLMGIFYILFSLIVNATGLNALKFIYLWIHVSLAWHLLPDDQDIYSIFNALMMIHIGSLLLGFAAICVTLFIATLGSTLIWTQPAIEFFIVTYTPFSTKVFGTLMGAMFAILTFTSLILHIKFRNASGSSKEISDNAWLNTVFLWKVKHGNKVYSPVTSLNSSIQTGAATKPHRTKSIIWTGIKLLILVIVLFIIIGLVTVVIF